jgi:hypothetical protein
MILTHNPFQPTPDSANYDATISSEQKLQDPKHFADMTAYMDKMVGRIVSKLDELGLRDNTLILFLGDNGTNSGITSRFQGRDYKGWQRLHQRARHARARCIASWPSVMKKGRVSSRPRQLRRLSAHHLRRHGCRGARRRRWRQLSPAAQRRNRHAARVALHLVLTAPEQEHGREGIRLRPALQALPHRPVLRL